MHGKERTIGLSWLRNDLTTGYFRNGRSQQIDPISSHYGRSSIEVAPAIFSSAGGKWCPKPIFSFQERDDRQSATIDFALDSFYV